MKRSAWWFGGERFETRGAALRAHLVHGLVPRLIEAQPGRLGGAHAHLVAALGRRPTTRRTLGVQAPLAVLGVPVGLGPGPLALTAQLIDRRAPTTTTAGTAAVRATRTPPTTTKAGAVAVGVVGTTAAPARARTAGAGVAIVTAATGTIGAVGVGGSAGGSGEVLVFAVGIGFGGPGHRVGLVIGELAMTQRVFGLGLHAHPLGGGHDPRRLAHRPDGPATGRLSSQPSRGTHGRPPLATAPPADGRGWVPLRGHHPWPAEVARWSCGGSCHEGQTADHPRTATGSSTSTEVTFPAARYGG